MTWYDKLWNWLDGNKMIFGLAILKLADWVPPDHVLFGFVPTRQLLEWVGGLLTGVGGLHKLMKATTDPGPNP